MRVLLVSDVNLWPLLGGLQRHVYSLARYLTSAGLEVAVLTSGDAFVSRRSSFDGVKLIPDIRILRRNVPGLKTLWDSINVARNVRKHSTEYDLIHYHTTGFFYQTPRKPTICTMHFDAACILGDRVTNPCHRPSSIKCTLCALNQESSHMLVSPLIAFYSGIYYRLATLSLRKCYRVICASDYLEQAVVDVFGLSNVTKIHNFIDIDGEIEPAISTEFNVRKYLGIPQDAKIIVYFGRLVYLKGVDVLISAMKLIHEGHKGNAYLVVGGDGPLRPELEEMSKSVGRILFIGVPPRNLQLKLMAQCDIFVYPSRAPETCPIAILEAMAVGLPVVATGEWNREFVREKRSGYIVKPDSQRELAQRIVSVLEDEEFRQRAGEYNKRKSEEFDIKIIGPKILRLYEEAT